MTERWQERAACKGRDLSQWFPLSTESGAEAKAICAGCPVRADCLAEHLWEPYGIWGGKSEQQRATLRKGTGRPYREWTSCAGCVSPFQPTSGRQRYCSAACRQRTSKQRIYERDEGAA